MSFIDSATMKQGEGLDSPDQDIILIENGRGGKAKIMKQRIDTGDAKPI